jgi:outer membrane protein assembly factor BamB
VIGGLVYFSTFAGRTYAADAEVGRIEWQYDDGRYSPAVTWGESLILMGSRTIYALTMAK